MVLVLFLYFAAGAAALMPSLELRRINNVHDDTIQSFSFIIFCVSFPGRFPVVGGGGGGGGWGERRLPNEMDGNFEKNPKEKPKSCLVGVA